MYANELDFNYRVGWIQDGTFDFDHGTDTFEIEPYEFGTKDSYPSPGNRVLKGIVGHSYVPSPEGFTFPVLVSKAHADSFGYHWSSGTAVSDDWSLKTIFGKMVGTNSGFRSSSGTGPSKSWTYPSLGTDGTREILAESYINIFGSDHGFSQNRISNYPDAGKHPESAFGLDISGRNYYSDFSPVEKVWPSALSASPSSREYSETAVSTFKLQYHLQRNRGVALFFKRHLMNGWTVSQERIEQMLPGKVVRAPQAPDFADNLLLSPVIHNKVFLPEKITLFNRMSVNLFDVTPQRTVQSLSLDDIQILDQAYQFEIPIDLEFVSLSSVDLTLPTSEIKSQTVSSAKSASKTETLLFFHPDMAFETETDLLDSKNESSGVTVSIGHKTFDFPAAQPPYNFTSTSLTFESLPDKSTGFAYLKFPAFTSVASVGMTIRVSSEGGWDMLKVYRNLSPDDLQFVDPRTPLIDSSQPWVDGTDISGEATKTVSIDIQPDDTLLLTYAKDWNTKEGEDLAVFSDLSLNVMNYVSVNVTNDDIPMLNILDANLVVVKSLAGTVNSQCANTDAGRVDSYGDGCDVYTSYPSYCGDSYNNTGFNSTEQCCACEGGASANFWSVSESITSPDLLTKLTSNNKMLLSLSQNAVSSKITASFGTTPIPSNTLTASARFPSDGVDIQSANVNVRRYKKTYKSFQLEHLK